MAPPRMTVISLWALPLAAIVVLAGWTLADVLAIPDVRFAELFGIAALLGLGGIAMGLQFGIALLRRAGLVVLAGTYVLAHVFVLAMDPAVALGYLTLALLAAELRILADRFAPIYGSALTEADRERVDEALRRATLRIAAAAAVAFLGSYLTADLAFSGTVPVTSIASALLLSMALIVVIFVLALWPLVERWLGWETPEERPIQTPK